MKWLKQLFLLFLIAHVLVSGHYFRDVFGVNPRPVSTDEYQQIHDKGLASDLPIPELLKALNENLPGTESLRLSGQLDDFFVYHQRLSEILYPRTLDSQATSVLSFSEPGHALPPETIELSKMGDKNLVLSGQHTKPAHGFTPSESFDFDWSDFLAALAVAVGLGAFLVALLRMTSFEQFAPLFPLLILSGAAAVGALYSVATWIQKPVSLPVLLGIALLGWGMILGTLFSKPLRHFPAKWIGQIRKGASRFDVLFFLIVCAFLFARMMNHPLDGWDGRSNWLFRTKQIFFQGMLTSSDALNPAYQFGHPWYPLLFPAWMAHFTFFSHLYNERVAALGIPVLLVQVMSLVWILLQERIGASSGTLVVMAGYMATRTLNWGGYTDGLLMFTLALEFLGLTATIAVSGSGSNENHKINGMKLGWLAAFVASLIKAEGFLFAIWIAVSALLLRKNDPRYKRSLLPFLIFIFPAGQLLWNRSMGFKTDFSGIQWSQLLGEFPSRSWTILKGFGETFGYSALSQEACVALIVTALLLYDRRKSAKNLATSQLIPITGAIVGMSGMIFAMYIVAPTNVHDLVSCTLDRLILHPAFLAIMLPFTL